MDNVNLDICFNEKPCFLSSRLFRSNFSSFGEESFLAKLIVRLNIPAVLDNEWISVFAMGLISW